MTVREVAEILGVTPEAIKKHVREMWPESIRNGTITMLDEDQVTRIKARMRPTTEVVGSYTRLEMVEKARDVMAWMTSEVEHLREELNAAQPAIESHTALMRSTHNMSISDAAKHFGLHPKAEVFPYLRERGYLTQHDLPTQAALDAGYLSLRETKCPDGSVRPQAVVETRQLETWRVRVIPQIMAWEARA